MSNISVGDNVAFNNIPLDDKVVSHVATQLYTGNEMVQNGLVSVIEADRPKVVIPNFKVSDVLRPYEATPTADSDERFVFGERAIETNEFQVYNEFNPLAFDFLREWMKAQGRLVFRELSPEIQSLVLNGVLRKAAENVGDVIINGDTGLASPLPNRYINLIDGFAKQIDFDPSVIKVGHKKQTMTDKLKVLFNAIPKEMRGEANLKILCSYKDADQYDFELKAQYGKGADWTDRNKMTFNMIPIIGMKYWPENYIVATLASTDFNSNLFVAVGLNDDFNTIQVDKVSNASDLWFVKMSMRLGVGMAWPAHTVALTEYVLPKAAPTSSTFASGTYYVHTGTNEYTEASSFSANETYYVKVA